MESYTMLAERFLKELGKPAHFKEITDYVVKHKEIKGKTPYATLLSAMMRNKEKFNRQERGLYGLKEWGANENGTEKRKPWRHSSTSSARR